MAWCLADEEDAYSTALLDDLPASEAVVPTIWPLEVANALLTAERRNRLTPAESAQLVAFLTRLPVVVDPGTSSRAFAEILALARASGLSSYDAAYLELAMREGLPLATIDRGLRAVAATLGIALAGEPAGPAD